MNSNMTSVSPAVEKMVQEKIKQEKRKNITITVGQILSLIDVNRDSSEYVVIKDCNGNLECRAMIRSSIWDSIENRAVSCMRAEDDEIVLWLADLEVDLL